MKGFDVKHQANFTDTEAQAICEKIAQLTEEDYQIVINGGAKQDNDLYPYIVTIKDTDDEVIATAADFFLITALDLAYENTMKRRDIWIYKLLIEKKGRRFRWYWNPPF